MSGTAESRSYEIKATEELPSPFGIALTLLALIQRDDTTIADIAQVLQGDPALTGRLLKFVNSPFVGQRRAVVSVSDAILLVGLHAIRQIVVGLSVLSAYRSGRCKGFNYDRFWARRWPAPWRRKLCPHVIEDARRRRRLPAAC